MSPTGRRSRSGLEFGPTSSGKLYLSMYAHRGNNPRKSQWADHIAPPAEFELFVRADADSWVDSRGHYWAVGGSDCPIIGSAYERIAKFPRNDAAAHPWHGYPVSPLNDGDPSAPEDNLVEQWLTNGVVGKVQARRIQRRKL